LANQILRRNRDLLEKFFEITERKISVLDAYGDEKWDALPGEILLFMKKLAQRERRAIDWREYSKAKRKIKGDPAFAKTGKQVRLAPVLPKEYQLIEKKLAVLFKEYHERRKGRSLEEIDVDALSGIEFQTHVAKTLRSSGYDVMGPPISGDQGGDLIAKKEGKSYVVQTKRSERPVGNRAVQEAISAVTYYGGDQGWVITNSTFTPSAITLAQKAHIKLIDGLALRTKTFH
jgi:restriction endonuclease Mrr